MITWILVKKDRESKDIISVESFGSFRKLVEVGDLYIRGFKMPEGSLRKELKKGDDFYEDDNYLIAKVELQTKKHN